MCSAGLRQALVDNPALLFKDGCPLLGDAVAFNGSSIVYTLSLSRQRLLSARSFGGQSTANSVDTGAS
jgi:hypothetical protein